MIITIMFAILKKWNFVSFSCLDPAKITTNFNRTFKRRLESKYSLVCEASGNPTPTVKLFKLKLDKSGFEYIAESEVRFSTLCLQCKCWCLSPSGSGGGDSKLLENVSICPIFLCICVGRSIWDSAKIQLMLTFNLSSAMNDGNTL